MVNIFSRYTPANPDSVVAVNAATTPIAATRQLAPGLGILALHEHDAQAEEDKGRPLRRLEGAAEQDDREERRC